MDLSAEITPDLWAAVRDHYEAGQYSLAVLDALRVLTNNIRNKTGLDGDGVALVGQAFGGATPPVRLNALRTNSEQDEQRGYEHMLRGIYTGIRNPRTHDDWPDTKKDADAIIVFLDLIVRRVEQAHTHFDLAQYRTRVFDPLFVETAEYAQLLVSEIPAGELVQVFQLVFGDRAAGDPKKLSVFFRALLQRMPEADQRAAMRIMSDALRQATSDGEITSVIRFVRPDLWPMVARDVKLRIESRIIASVADGRMDAFTGIAAAGHLGSWANSLGRHFEQRPALVEALARLLHNDWYTQNYVGKFFIYSLPSIAATQAHVDELCDGIAYAAFVNDARVLRSQLLEAFSRYPAAWQRSLQQAALQYRADDEEFFDRLFGDDDDDDLPF